MGAEDVRVRGEQRPVLADAVDVEQPLFAELVLGVEESLLRSGWVREMAQSKAGKKMTPSVEAAFSMETPVGLRVGGNAFQTGPARRAMLVSASSRAMTAGCTWATTRMFEPRV